jgi:DNA-binding SARP family transcriptional activator
MQSLRLDLLGGFSARLDGGQPLVLPARKAQGLLAFLALPPGRWHSREKLTAFLWGDAPETQARQAFRQTLSRLRRALPASGRRLLADGQDGLALDATTVSVDVVEFEAAMSAGSPLDLERAARLYRGDLLDGFNLDEAPFEEWRTVERERLRELALEALARLLRAQTTAAETAAAIRTAMRLLAMDPLQEAVHRSVMRLLAGEGRRALALQQYQSCVASLQGELGAEPEEETRQLYREILRSTRAVSGTSTAASSAEALIPGARAVDTPMIGRDAEAEQLRRAASRALDEGGHVVLVTGEAGIGKSRLIQELAASEALRPFRLLFGRCHATEQTLPFRPWIEALRGGAMVPAERLRQRLGAATCAQLSALFPELAAASDTGPASAAPATLLFEPLLELVGALASEQPLAIVVEDLHWADTMSARLLAFLGRRLQRWPVLVVGSTRPEELVDTPALVEALRELRDDGRLQEVALGPLSEDQSRMLARALQPSPPAGQDREALEREIWEVSEGSPFVIVESVRGLQQGTSTAGARLGRRVEDAVGSRLERLAERRRHCVEVAATIGRDFSFALLARASALGEREAADAVEELVRRRLLDSVGDRLDFCHDWIRMVAYQRLLPSKRALLHAAIGEALEELSRERLDEVADRLGSHYWRAGNFEKAIPWLIRVGHLAARRYALDDAYRVLAQAMEGVDRLAAGTRDRTRLQVALLQAYLLSILGRHREILDLLQRHEGALRRIDDAAIVSEYHFRLALTQFFLGERTEAERAAGRALREGERLGEPAAIGKALHVLSLQAYEMGRPREGAARASRAIPLLDRPDTQEWLGLAHYDLALNHLAAGDLEAALAAGERVEQISRSAGIPRLGAFAAFVTGWVQILRGEAALAIETVQGALAISRDAIVANSLSGVLGHARLELGDATGAVKTLARVVEQLERGHRLVRIRNMVLLAEAYLLAGDLARAREVAAEALRLGQADGPPFNIGLAQCALGRIAHAAGEHAAAEVSLGEALESFEGCQATFEAARTRVELAAVRVVQGDADAARAHLAAALAVFEAAGAPARAAAARRLAPPLAGG